MATYQVTPPEPFTFTRPEEWQKWIRRFERFRKASGLEAKQQEAQVNTLIYTMGDEADDILRSFSLSEDEQKVYDTVKTRFERHFVKRRNIIFERAKFNSRKQEQGETVDAFITALYGLAEHCNYGNLHNEMIRDRIVVGICDVKLSEKLQLDPDLTLDKAVAQVRQSELVKQQQPVIRGEAQNSPVGAVHSDKAKSNYSGNRYGSSSNGGHGSRPNDYHRRNGPRQTHHQEECGRCGNAQRHDFQRCPARKSLCRKCNRYGHFQQCCRSPEAFRRIQQVQSEEPEEEFFLGNVQSRTQQTEQVWRVTLQLNNSSVDFHIDTGAEVTVISKLTYQSIGSPSLLPAAKVLKGPSDHSLGVLGQFRGNFTTDVGLAQQEIYVVDHLQKNLLGQPAIDALGLVARVREVNGVEQEVIQKFPKLFEGLGKLKGDYTIQLEDRVQPSALGTSRRVPIPLMKAVKEELTRMEDQGVIAKVNEPTDWCAGMVVVPKKNGKVRICVDLTKLNRSVKRERHPMPAVEQILAQIAGAKVFTKLDANSGFWQIPLSAESALLTTFITPFGRYCFHRLPFGISSAPEHFQRRMSEVLSGLEGVVGLVDDVLIYGKTQEEHGQRLHPVLKRIEEANLTLNRQKCEFSVNRVKFLGQVIDHSGVHPDPEKVQAIQEMKPPEDVSGVRRFLGIVNQMSKFIPNSAEVTQPLRELLIRDNLWTWGEPQKVAFQSIKNLLTTAPILALFDPALETIVSADASSYGLGAVLLQKQRDGSTNPIAFVSRSMTSAETRYAQIEKEALAFTWACERLSDYLVGLSFHIETDHKPLVPLFSSKNLDDLPLRVQRFRLRMMRFNFTISHVPGKQLIIADTLSRAPVSMPKESDIGLTEEANAFIQAIVKSLPISERRLEEIRLQQGQDDACKLVAAYCQTGWPEKQKLPDIVRPYHHVAPELSVSEGLLMRCNRIVIPKSLRLGVLNEIHSGHQGLNKCRLRANQCVWWPKLSSELMELVNSCTTCRKAGKQQPQPLITSTLPELPWQKVGTDLFEWRKKNYLLIVDYYSRYIEIARLDRTTADEVISRTKSIFARHGIPEIVVSDNGPQFSAAHYSNFAQSYGFDHITSSPYFPQSNGEAERAVGTIKRLLNKEEDPYMALLAYHTTPLQNGYSPSELLMSRRLRSTVPISLKQRMPEKPDMAMVRDRDEEIKEKQKRNFDRRHRSTELPPLSPGDLVWLPSQEKEAVVGEEVAPRSYQVITPNGFETRRNRQDLIALPEVQSLTTNAESPDTKATTQREESPDLNTPTAITEPQLDSLRRSTRPRKQTEKYDPSKT